VLFSTASENNVIRFKTVTGASQKNEKAPVVFLYGRAKSPDMAYNVTGTDFLFCPKQTANKPAGFMAKAHNIV
jgi:hypothetical protein